MEVNKSRQLYQRLFVIFMAFMAVCTVLSRVLDSMTVSKVGTTYCKAGNVVYTVNGEGIFEAGEEQYLFTQAGLTFGSIEKKTGDSVRAGEVLFSYRMEDLEEKERELSLNLKKQSLELSELDVQAKTVQTLTQEELALQALDTAKRALEQGKSDAGTQRQKADEKINELKKKYNDSMNLTEAEMEEETRRSYKNAERTYDAAVKKKENAVKKAERTVNELEQKLEKLEDQGATEEELEEVQDALSEAEESAAEIREEEDLNVEMAYAAMKDAEEDYGDVSRGYRSAADTLTGSFEASVEAEEEKVNAKEEMIRSLEEAVRLAELSLANAGKQDAASQAETAKQAEILDLQRQAKELDIEETLRKLKVYQELIAQAGQVLSPWDGIITEMEATVGKTATGEELICVGGSRLILKGHVERKPGTLLSPGMKITAEYGEKVTYYDGTVEAVEFLGADADAIVTAVLEENVGTVGASAFFTAEVKSQMYDRTIPISALRQDNRGYYVFLAEPAKTILGEELTAVRIDVEVLEKSSTQAAINGPLGRDSRLITSSSKTIEEGDRVRETNE